MLQRQGIVESHFMPRATTQSEKKKIRDPDAQWGDAPTRKDLETGLLEDLTFNFEINRRGFPSRKAGAVPNEEAR